ncbi:hypothetical protein OH77DRAFT_194236, partial [Trametes cingulata]
MTGKSRRELYQFTSGATSIKFTPEAIPSAIRVLATEELLQNIVWAIVPPLRAEVNYLQDTLNAVLRTCTVFFHVAAGAYWSRLHRIDFLVAILRKDSCRDRGTFYEPPHSLAFQSYIKNTFGRSMLEDDQLRTLHHFMFYASCVERLETSATLAPAALLHLLQSIIPDKTPLFPRLRALTWSSGHKQGAGYNLPSECFAPLCAGPQTLHLYLRIPRESEVADALTATEDTVGRTFRDTVNSCFELLEHADTARIREIHISVFSPYWSTALGVDSLKRRLIDLFIAPEGSSASSASLVPST